MNIDKQIDVLSKGRFLMLKLIKDLSLEEINTIPKGFKNNIGWNIAHLVVTQQLLCYKFSALKTSVPNDTIERYKKGTSPNDYLIKEEEWEDIKSLFIKLPKQLLIDYNNQIFKEYKEYTTSVNVSLDSVEKAIDFNNFHEGIHLGVILAIRKLI